MGTGTSAGTSGMRETKTLFGYTVHIVPEAEIVAKETGIKVVPRLNVVVEEKDKEGGYIYKIEEETPLTYPWLGDADAFKIYADIHDKLNFLAGKVKQKLEGLEAVKEMLEKRGVKVEVICWGYHKSEKDIEALLK